MRLQGEQKGKLATMNQKLATEVVAEGKAALALL